MRNTKGFTLMEIMTVVIVIGILVALSIPNIAGYARDARNDRAKAILNMVAQGYKNFRNDFSGVNLSTTANSDGSDGYGPLKKDNTVLPSGNQDSCDSVFSSLVPGTSNPSTGIGYNVLIKCSYIRNIDYPSLRYAFYLGNGNGHCSACGSLPTTTLACMVGAETSGPYDSSYCAYIDENSVLKETAI